MNIDNSTIAAHFENVIKPSAAYKDNEAKVCINQDLLLPEFRDYIDRLEKLCKDEGIQFRRSETFRTNALQIHYYRSGQSKIKINGMHHFGIAQDVDCLDENGKVITRGDDEAYRGMRKIAVSMGLHILSEWDARHLQGIPVSGQNSLRQYISNYSVPKGSVVILHYGMENHFVGNLKAALGKLGYTVNTDTYFFGDQTDESLRKFQLDYKLVVDGIAGPKVYTKLKELGYDIR